MADERRHRCSRRGVLKAALVMGAGGALLSAPASLAQQKASKEATNYQDTPKDGQKCSDCRFFIAPEGGAEMGACQVVAGEIHPNGWCTLYTPAS